VSLFINSQIPTAILTESSEIQTDNVSQDGDSTELVSTIVRVATWAIWAKAATVAVATVATARVRVEIA
jgi:hypothetical protein